MIFSSKNNQNYIRSSFIADLSSGRFVLGGWPYIPLPLKLWPLPGWDALAMYFKGSTAGTRFPIFQDYEPRITEDDLVKEVVNLFEDEILTSLSGGTPPPGLPPSTLLLITLSTYAALGYVVYRYWYRELPVEEVDDFSLFSYPDFQGCLTKSSSLGEFFDPIKSSFSSIKESGLIGLDFVSSISLDVLKGTQVPSDWLTAFNKCLCLLEKCGSDLSNVSTVLDIEIVKSGIVPGTVTFGFLLVVTTLLLKDYVIMMNSFLSSGDPASLESGAANRLPYNDLAMEISDLRLHVSLWSNSLSSSLGPSGGRSCFMSVV